MSIIKSFSVGNGDMFYIKHNSDNFTIIDCCLSDDNDAKILSEIKSLRKQKTISRFISTHPDDDHLKGLEYLEHIVGVQNFYCVKNNATKDEETISFKKYKQLRDDDKKAFYIFKGCSRKWMNQDGDGRGSSGINILWPNTDNGNYKLALAEAEAGCSPNNISAVIKYSLNGGATFLWMGDLETEFMESIKDELELSPVDILFAPHHGRDSGKIPSSILEQLNPKIIVVGEAKSEHLHYYPDYNTITQNSAGDIVFKCENEKIHVFTSEVYSVDYLEDEGEIFDDMHYVGTLDLEAHESV